LQAQYFRDRPVALAWLLLLVLALIWGTSFILIKRGLDTFSPLQVGGLRIIFAGVVVLPLTIRRFRHLSPRQMKWLFITGLTGSMVPSVLFALAQMQLDSAVTGALNALTPIFVLLLGALLFGQKILKQSLLGISVGFLGTLVLIVSGSGGALGELNYAVFLVVAGTFCYGLNSNIIKYKLPKIPPRDIAALSLVGMVPLAGGLLLGATDITEASRWSGDWAVSLGAIASLGIIATAFALILFNRLIQLTNPVFTSTVTYFIPIVALFWGVLDGEKLQVNQLLGMAAVIFGVYLANRKRGSR
jgi:drug/metabolite transporter (DMT)-like permease